MLTADPAPAHTHSLWKSLLQNNKFIAGTCLKTAGPAPTRTCSFWKNLSLNPPLYGADVQGSLFDENLKVGGLHNCVKCKVDGAAVMPPPLYGAGVQGLFIDENLKVGGLHKWCRIDGNAVMTP